MQAFHSQFTDFNLMVEVEIKKKRQIEATSRPADCPDLFNQKWAYLSSIQMYIQKRIDTIKGHFLLARQFPSFKNSAQIILVANMIKF